MLRYDQTGEYRAALAALPAADWEPYLLAHSNLPGPRGNLELAAAAADLGTEAQFRRWVGLGPDVAPENTPGCFLAFCGVVGLGAIMARGAGRGEVPSPGLPYHDAARGNLARRRTPPLRTLRTLASDPRWRIREAVAMALQRWGDADMAGLLAEMADWAAGNPLEQRAAAAALCEPRLLRHAGARGRGPRDPGRDHGVHRAGHRPQERRVQDAAPGAGLLLERRRRRAAGRRASR